MPFPFTAGAEPNGKTIVTPLRLYQDWLDRDAEHAFAARSTFSFGLQTLGATLTSPAPVGTPTSNYFFWLGQVQYVRRIYEDWEILVRSDLQLANRPLFQMEQIAFGGLGSVRGYRTYLTVTDDGFLGSAELRIPVGQVRLPYLADSDVAGTVQIVPFYDYARAWNVDRPTPYPQQISGVGAGVRWNIGSGLTAEVLLRQGAAACSCGQLDRGSRHLLPSDIDPVLASIVLRFGKTDLVHQRVERPKLVEIRSRGEGVIPQTGVCKEPSAMGRGCGPHRSVEIGIERKTHQGCARNNVARWRVGVTNDRYRPGIDDPGFQSDTMICKTDGVDAGGLRRRDIRFDDWSGLARGADRQTRRIGNPPGDIEVKSRRRTGGQS